MNSTLRTLALCGLLALGGCGGSVTQSVESGGSTAPASSDPTPGAQIQALETAGKLPRLDRSNSIAGPDANANDVRDDIEQWIKQLDMTGPQKRAALQMAEAMQRLLLVDLNDAAALQASAEASADGVSCLHDTFSESRRASELGRQIEAFTANTDLRARRYLAYNARRSGTTTRMLSTNTCKP